ncbi:MAG TPA: hypothetical protein VEB21_18325, partial [Terriglobales bacterium]|nr:hypothetical protein [Terriglobales bacterium]
MSKLTPRVAVVALLLALFAAARVATAQLFLDEVVSFRPGTGAGFGQDLLPGIVLGRPEGAGSIQGSFDVVSLGNGGEIVVRFAGGGACDGPGDDFVVFENAFHAGSAEGPIFVEAGIVSVSADGQQFVELPYDPSTYAGLAGRTPVFSNPENQIDPRHRELAGGDAFDLALIGMERARFVRILDPGEAIEDPGNRVPPGINGGFDLDAAVVLNECTSTTPSPSPTALAISSPTATATATATATPLVRSGDVNGDGEVDIRDQDHLIAEIFDGDGDQV